MLSKAFFNGFSERYGVDVVIKCVRYENVSDVLDQEYRLRGPAWSSFVVDESMYFNIYRNLEKMPLSERKE